MNQISQQQCFRQRSSHRMVPQDKSSSFHMARASPEISTSAGSYEDRKSAWKSGVRKAIRRGSAEEEVRKHHDRVTGALK